METILNQIFRGRSASDEQNVEDPGAAITDLWDEAQGGFAVHYRIRVVVVMALWGFAALGLLGFLGYVDDDHWTRGLSEAAVYLWLCAVLLLLLLSILRHSSLRTVRRGPIAVALVSIIVVGALYVFNANLESLLQQLNWGELPSQIVQNPGTYVLVNFAIIVIFLAITARRFFRHFRGLPLYSYVEIGSGSAGALRQGEEQVQTSELVAGDMLAGAAISAVLALIVFQPIFSQIWQDVGLASKFPTPELTAGASGPALSLLDVIMSLAFVVIGLISLVIAGAVEVFSGNVAVGAKSVWEGIPLAVRKIVEVAFTRRWDALLRYIALSWRFLWPVMIFIAVGLVALATRTLRIYLHLLNAVWICQGNYAPSACPDAQTSAHFSELPSGFSTYPPYDMLAGGQFMALTALFGLVALVLIVGAISLVLFRSRIFTNALKFLALSGGALVLLTLFVTLAMSAFNKGYELVWKNILGNDHVRWPFPQPSLVLFISAGAWVLVLLWLLIDRVRRSSVGKPV
jgi:hypothetical protein